MIKKLKDIEAVVADILLEEAGAWAAMCREMGITGEDLTAHVWTEVDVMCRRVLVVYDGIGCDHLSMNSGEELASQAADMGFEFTDPTPRMRRRILGLPGCHVEDVNTWSLAIYPEE